MASTSSLQDIKARLGAPAGGGEEFLLYQGDCTELMRLLPSETFDLTITSPPYNIGKEYESVLPIDEYIDWCEGWIASIYRLTRPTGAFWLNLGYMPLPRRAKAVPIPYLIWDKVPFFMIQEVVWNYGAGIASKLSLSPRNEKFLWYVKDENKYIFNLDAIRDPDVKYPDQKKNGKLKCNPLGKNPTDVWRFPKVTSGSNRSSRERTPHPAQFPLAVAERIVLACSDEGDVLFDPFVGSGSLIEAAIRNGRKAVGFEINPAYVDIAMDRLDHKRGRHSNFIGACDRSSAL